MKKKLVAGLVSGLFLTSCMVCMAETLIIKASSSNDAQYVSSSTGSPTVDETSHFDAGGWSVYPVYHADGSYDTGFTYNASLIEFDLSKISSNDIIDSVTLNINVAKVIQKYNSDTKLALLSHLRSSGYTGDAKSDYWHIDGPTPKVDTLYHFYSGSFTGWKQIDVTNDINTDLDEGIKWAAFWISPAPWEDLTQIAWEAKGVSVAAADNDSGMLAPYLKIDSQSPPTPVPKPATSLLFDMIPVFGHLTRK